MDAETVGVNGPRLDLINSLQIIVIRALADGQVCAHSIQQTRFITPRRVERNRIHSGYD